MKRFIILAVAFFTAAAVYAQPRAIGARFGNGFEFSYQHFVRNVDFIEFDLGAEFPLQQINDAALNFSATVFYDFVFAQPHWTSKGTWQWYAGPGATVGVQASDGDGSFLIGTGGNIGLSYTFWFPLELSIDNRIMLGFNSRANYHFYLGGLLIPTLSVRYRF